MRKVIAALLCLGLSGVPAAAQDAAKLKELEGKIDALSREMERIKVGESMVEPVALGQKPGEAPAASKVYRAAPSRVSIGGYGEMLYQNLSKRRQNGSISGSRDTVDFLRAVVYVGYKYNDWILFNSELEFEHGSTAASGAGSRGSVSIEQAYVDFKLHPMLGIRAGTLLVPMGIVNELHEPTTFVSARRPSVETNIIPSTWRENGAGIFGEVGPVSYKSYVVTGLQAVSNNGVTGFSASTGLRSGRSSGANSFAEDFASVTRVDVSPVEGLRAGGSIYVGEADHNFTAAAVPVTLWDLHAMAEYRGAELRAVYAQGRIGNADRVNAAQGVATAATGSSSIGSRLWGGYLEGAFNVLTLTPSKQYLAPFFRYERYDTQASTPDAWGKSPANSRVEYTAGFSYKPIPHVAVKVDHQWMRNQARTGVNQWNMAIAYMF